MLHFQMCNVSKFVQISSVLGQRSTAPTRLLMWSRPGKGPAVWHPSKMLSSQKQHFSRTVC